jgi:hypothetical protein
MTYEKMNCAIEPLIAKFLEYLKKLLAASGASAAIAIVGMAVLSLANHLEWTERTVTSQRLVSSSPLHNGPIYALPVGGVMAQVTWELKSCTSPLIIEANPSARAEMRPGPFFGIVNVKPWWAQWSIMGLSIQYTAKEPFLASIELNATDTTLTALKGVNMLAKDGLSFITTQITEAATPTSGGKSDEKMPLCAEKQKDAIAELAKIKKENPEPDEQKKALIKLLRESLTITKAQWLHEVGDYTFQLTLNDLRTLIGDAENLANAGFNKEKFDKEIGPQNQFTIELTAPTGSVKTALPKIGTTVNGIIYHTSSSGSYRICRQICTAETDDKLSKSFDAPQFGATGVLKLSSGFLQSRVSRLCFNEGGALKSFTTNSSSTMNSGSPQGSTVTSSGSC